MLRLGSLFLIALALRAADAVDWIMVSSTNFELYTTYSETEARRTLETFEQARQFFVGTKAFPVASGLPLRVVAFSDPREYRPYALGALVPAYFIGGEDGDYIVMSDLEGEQKRVAVHEYVHALVRHSGLSLPVWLNEGLAEVYSGMETRGGKVLLGEIPHDRSSTLARSNWMRLGVLTRIGHDSPGYNEKNRTGVFYAQSCLLAHMLMLGDGYSAKFPAFVDRISISGSAQEAFSQVYGKSFADVERDLNAYFRQPTIGGSAYTMPLEKVVAGPARAVNEVEIGLTLARILAMTGRPSEAMKQLQRLSASNKDNSELDEALAFLEWRNGDVDTALRHFQEIVGRPGAGWRAYWDYARVLEAKGGGRVGQLDALRKAVELNPNLPEARILLGGRLFVSGQVAESLAVLKQVKSIEPERAAGMYLAMASAAMQLKQPKEAATYAAEARKYARTPDDVAAVDRILRMIETAGAGGKNAPEVQPEKEDDPGPPVLRRKTKKQS